MAQESGRALSIKIAVEVPPPCFIHLFPRQTRGRERENPLKNFILRSTIAQQIKINKYKNIKKFFILMFS
jgi:hypothetical protein